jgi:hypothetical protein
LVLLRLGLGLRLGLWIFTFLPLLFLSLSRFQIFKCEEHALPAAVKLRFNDPGVGRVHPEFSAALVLDQDEAGSSAHSCGALELPIERLDARPVRLRRVCYLPFSQEACVWDDVSLG